MNLLPGIRLRSISGSTEIVVVRAPTRDIDLRCGGHQMVPVSDSSPTDVPARPGFGERSEIGKRYVHEDTGLEVLCTKAGTGSLSVGDEPLPAKNVKPLPSSD